MVPVTPPLKWKGIGESRIDSVAARCEDPRWKHCRRDPTAAPAWNVPRQRLQPAVSSLKLPGCPPVRRHGGVRRRKRSERRSSGFAALPVRSWERGGQGRTHSEFRKHFVPRNWRWRNFPGRALGENRTWPVIYGSIIYGSIVYGPDHLLRPQHLGDQHSSHRLKGRAMLSDLTP